MRKLESQSKLWMVCLLSRPAYIPRLRNLREAARTILCQLRKATGERARGRERAQTREGRESVGSERVRRAEMEGKESQEGSGTFWVHVNKEGRPEFRDPKYGRIVGWCEPDHRAE